MTYSEKLKSLREAANLNQTQLAKKIDVDPSAVNKWEHGINPPLLKYAKKLAELFNVSVEEILEED